MTPNSPGILIRAAVKSDVPKILEFVRALAEFEKLSSQVTATEAQLEATLFGANPAAEVILAESTEDHMALGFALYFQNYSTFLARPGIYLEDLFVIPDKRSQGVGRSLLRRVAQIAVERNCERFEWAVLDWNKRAIQFYESLKAQPQSDWTTYRLSGAALRKLAETTFDRDIS